MLKDLEKSFYFKLLSISVGIFVAVYLFQLLYQLLGIFSDIILIVILSWLVAFIFEPLVRHLLNFGLSRLTSSLLVYGLFSVVLIISFVILVPILINQINSLLSILPQYVTSFPNWANKFFDFILSALSNTLELIQRVASFVFYFIIILMMSFYLSIDRERIWKNLLLFIPKNFRDELEFVQNTIDQSFTNFIKTQVIFGLLFGLIVFLPLIFLTPSYALMAALLSCIFTVLPLIGPILALIPPFLVLLPLGLKACLWLMLIIFILQQIELNVLGPKIIGSSMKMHPLVVLLAFLLGFKIAGIWGSIFALPMASVISVMVLALWPHFLTRIGKEQY